MSVLLWLGALALLLSAFGLFYGDAANTLAHIGFFGVHCHLGRTFDWRPVVLVPDWIGGGATGAFLLDHNRRISS